MSLTWIFSRPAALTLLTLAVGFAAEAYSLAKAADGLPVKTAPVGIRAGDSEKEVLRRLQKPNRVTRIAVYGRIEEQWLYPGHAPLYINLHRPTDRAPAQVLSVHTRQPSE